MSPEVAARATGRPLLASRRGTVLHLALGARPTCHQRGRRWHTPQPTDPRRLCSRCDAWATHTRPAAHWLSASPAEIHAALLAVTDPTELHHLVMAICSRRDLLHHVVQHPVHGHPQRLTFLVSAARERCAPSTSRRTR